MTATEQRTRSHEVGAAFAQELRSDRTVLGLWVRDCEDHVELWLHTEPIAHEHELHLYKLEMALYEHFSDACPELHIVHKGRYESPEFEFEVPLGAEPVYVR